MSTFAFPFGTKHKRSEQECKTSSLKRLKEVQQVPRTKKRALILFFRKMNKLSGSNWKYVYYTKKSLILAQDER